MKKGIVFIFVIVLMFLPEISSAEYDSVTEKVTSVESDFDMARTIANFMETQYGVTILIGSECNGISGDGFTLGDTPTGRTPFLNMLGLVSYESEIQRVDDAFSIYPVNFFELFRSAEAPNGLRILLPNQIIADGKNIAGVTTVEDGYYNVFLGAGAFRDLNIHHEIWHAIEFRILSENPNAFDKWSQLNPDGFVYSGEYFEQDIWEQAAPKDDWFVRGYSIINEEEDRATVIEAIFQYDEEWWALRPQIKKKLDALLEAALPVFGNVYCLE